MNKVYMDSADKAAVIIGLGFLFLVGFIFWYTLRTMKTTNDFLIVWTAVGPIVGVVIGSMPAHFFRSMVKTANDQANQMATHANEMAAQMKQMASEMHQMANMGNHGNG